jgi:LytS/YehU family sensor histidine kinase
MQMNIDIEENLDGKMIAPLLLIPFVENSFKHGASRMITEPWIKLNLSIEKNTLRFSIINSKPSSNDLISTKGNIGLKNVTKRLELLYAGTHELKIVSEPDSFSVYLSLQLHDLKDHTPIKDEIKPISEYAMA